MRKVREALRLSFDCKRSQREVASSLTIGVGTVVGYLHRVRESGLTWQELQPLSDEEVEAKLFRMVGRKEPPSRVPIDFPHIHTELRRNGVTLQLLWEEYSAPARQRGLVPYGYSQFCELYGAWRKRLQPTMRQHHRAGEKGFVDYSGKRPVLTDRVTGEQTPVELFVMVLGASSYTYAEATLTQKIPDFIASHTRALEFFGGVPEILVPDCLKSAVLRADRYDPDINATYQEMAAHYGIAVLPARPRKPRDKAKVEVAVQVVQRWILARLRNRTFFTLGELNEAVQELLIDLNNRPFTKLEGCRRSVFESIDKPALKPLPSQRFELREGGKQRVNIDYHVAFDKRLYSVPYTLIQEVVRVQATQTMVEIFHNEKRVASHIRSYGPCHIPITDASHLPPQHADLSWPPSRLVNWASSAGGPHVSEVVQLTLSQRRRPEHGYRACLGIIRLISRYGASRVEAACQRALAASRGAVPHRTYIEAILKNKLDTTPLGKSPSTAPPLTHENVRGGDYYDKKENIH